MPPIPAGRQAINAWRELDRETRTRLLAGEPHPNPTVAVVAVGYARAMLAGTRRRLRLPLLATVVCAVAVLVVVSDASGTWVLASPLGAAIYVLVLFPLVLALMLRTRRQNVRLLRMESVNASRLWATEVSPPPPAHAPAPGWAPVIPAGRDPVSFRYASRRVLTGFGILIAVLALLQLSWLSPDQRPLTVVLDCLLVPIVGWSTYRLVRHVRPWEPPVVLDAGGIAFPGPGVRVAWPEIIEIRVSPVRGGGTRMADRRVAAFIVGDPEGAVTRFRPFARKAARRSLEAYGTPIAVTDLLLERSVEDVIAAAGGFTSAPVRRFG